MLTVTPLEHLAHVIIGLSQRTADVFFKLDSKGFFDSTGFEAAMRRISVIV